MKQKIKIKIMETKISKQLKRIQTLAVILTLSFTGIPVSPVWAGSTTTIDKAAGTTLAEKSVTAQPSAQSALKAPASVGKPGLADSLLVPGPLSKVPVTKAPTNFKAPMTTAAVKTAVKTGPQQGPQGKGMASKAPVNNANLKGAAATSAGLETSGMGLDVEMIDTSAHHLEFLKQVYTMGRLSTDGKSRDFSDGTGKVVVTVYYKSGKIEKITYKADPANFSSYFYNTSDGTWAGCDACSGITLYPTVISLPGVSPLKTDLAFYNTEASLKKFLDTFYIKVSPRAPRGQQMTRYFANSSWNGPMVALADVEVDEYGNVLSAAYTTFFRDINEEEIPQVFTYGEKTGNTLALTKFDVDSNAPKDFSYVPAPEAPATYTVPDFLVAGQAKTHLAYLKLAYTLSSKSTSSKKFFLDAGGRVAATVYYESGKIEKIAYADPYYTYLYKDIWNEVTEEFSRCGDDEGSCEAPPMEPTIISEAGSPLKMNLVFQNTQTAHTKFLDTFFHKYTPLRTQKNRQVTIYRRYGQGAMVDVTLDDSGKQVSATIIYPGTHQVFTYGLDKALTGYDVADANIDFSYNLTPEPTSTFTLPNFVWRRNATTHLAYLETAYKKSPQSTSSTKYFLDAAGKVAATVYYVDYYGTNDIIERIAYADPYYTYLYDEGVFAGCDKYFRNSLCRAPPMDPVIISQPGSPLKMDLVFYNTQTAHTKFLDTFYYYKVMVLRTLKNHQVTVYKRGRYLQGAMVDVTLDDSGEQVSATITYTGTHQVFTYGSSKALTGYGVKLDAPTVPPNPVPQSTPAITVPESLWKEDAKTHYDYLTQAYKAGSGSGTASTKTFKDAAGKVAATVYYEVSVSDGKIKAIIYADGAFGYFYNPGMPNSPFRTCQDYNNPNDSGICYPPPMTPKFSSSDATKLNLSTLTGPLFYGKEADHTKFLRTNYSEMVGPISYVDKAGRLIPNAQVLEYRDKTTLVTKVTVNVEFDSNGKKKKVTFTYADTGQVFTYDSWPKPPNALTHYTGPTA